MPRILEIAIQTAVSRRGVSVVAIPGDVALQAATTSSQRLHFPPPKPTVRPADEELEALATLLNESTTITILGGAGCAGAHAALIALARILNAPIVHAMRGKEVIEYDNPFDVGMTGLLGFSSGYHAMLGTDFPYQQFFPPDAKIVQIDIRGEQLGRRAKVDYGLVGDTQATLRALLPKLKQNHNDKHLKASLEHYRKARRELDELVTPGSGKKPIHPQYVVRTLDELAATDAIFSCDVGTPTVWDSATWTSENSLAWLQGPSTHCSRRTQPTARS
jgi:pyruvate dehydrogenase (quinone)